MASTPSLFTSYPHPVVLWLMQGTCVPLKGCWTLLANPVTTLLLTGRLELISAGEIQNSFQREGWRPPGCTIPAEEGDHMATRLLLDRGCRGVMWAQHGTTWKDSELICAYFMRAVCLMWKNRKPNQTPGDREAKRKAPLPSHFKLLPVTGLVWATGSRALMPLRWHQSLGWSFGGDVT